MSLFTFIDPTVLLTLISQPDPSLELILDQECLLSELKSSNPLIVNFLCKPPIFNSLIQYITQIPQDLPFPPSTSQKDYSKNKFPFIACEILSLENQNIAQYLLGINPQNTQDSDHGPIWNKLSKGKPQNSQPISPSPENKMPTQSQDKDQQEPPILNLLRFLDTPAPLNPTLAGYFAKILRGLIYFKSEYTAKLLFRTYPEFLKKLNNHIYCDSIQELISIVIKLETSYFLSLPHERYLIDRQNILKNIIANLFARPSEFNSDELYHHQLVNSSHVLVNLLSSSDHLNDGGRIIAPIFQRDTLEKILSGLKNADLINVFVPIIEQLCKYYIGKYALPWNPLTIELPFGQESIPEVNIQDNETFITEIVKLLPGIAKILNIENKELNPTPINFQYGITGYSFGHSRVKLIETIYCFFKLQNSKLNNEIKNAGLIPILLKLFTKNPWNSILHMNLLKIFVFIIQAGSEVLKRNLFDQAKILEFIVQAHKDSNFTINSKLKGTVQKGYMSHLLVLANKIDQSSDVLVHNYTRRSSDWLSFKRKVVEESNRKNAVVKESPTSNKNYTKNNNPSSSPNIFEEQDIFTTESLTKNEAFAALLGLNTANTPPPHFSKEEFKLELSSPCDPQAGQKLFKFGLSKQLQTSGHMIVDDDVISPTFSDNFGDFDIKEREDCEIKKPQSVEIKESFVSSTMSQSNFQDELFELVIDSPKKIVSPKLDSLKLFPKTIEDELIY